MFSQHSPDGAELAERNPGSSRYAALERHHHAALRVPRGARDDAQLLDVKPGKDLPMQKQFKIVIEKHTDGYVAYPVGLKGVVVGEGDTYEEALTDVKSAIRFHIETFGQDVLQNDDPVLEAFVAETEVAV